MSHSPFLPCASQPDAAKNQVAMNPISTVFDFTFNAQAHDVSEVTKTEYENCTNTGSNFGSSLLITLSTTGEHYYICTFPGHCLGGQKLSINVVPSTTSSSPSSAHSRAAAFGVAGAFMAVLTALFL